MTKMLAYHNDPDLKARFLKELAKHRRADSLMKGSYGVTDGRRWRGCAVGCSLRSMNKLAGKPRVEWGISTGVHARYPKELGIPEHLAYLEDRIFEGLPEKDAQQWPERFSKAIAPGADLSMVWSRFAVWLLLDVKQYANPAGKAAIDGVVALFDRRLEGNEPSSGEWAAWAAAYKRQADKLIQLLEQCKP